MTRNIPVISSLPFVSSELPNTLTRTPSIPVAYNSFNSYLAAKSKYFFWPSFIVAGTNINSMMFSAMPRRAGGSDKFMNSAGFSEKLLFAKAGIASMQNCRIIRRSLSGNPAVRTKSLHAGVSYTSVTKSG